MAAIIESSDSSGFKIPLRLQFVWRVGKRVLNIVKGVAGVVLIALGTLADQYNLVDVQDFVKTVFHSSAQLSLMVAGVTIGYVILQAILKMPKGMTARSNQNDGE